MQGLHAQGKPPVYQITEIEATNPEGYVKDYVPRAQAVIKGIRKRFDAIASYLRTEIANSAKPPMPF